MKILSYKGRNDILLINIWMFVFNIAIGMHIDFSVFLMSNFY